MNARTHARVLAQSVTAVLLLWTTFAHGGFLAGLETNAGETKRVERAIAAIPSGASEALLKLDGAGMIRSLKFRTVNAGGHLLRGAVLEMRWDGNNTAAVRVPLGDFFGLVRGRLEPFDSAMLKVRGERQGYFECDFPMPYANGAVITLTNESPVTLPSFFVVADIAKMQAAPDLRFTAGWGISRPALRGEGHSLLNVRGRGILVGTVIDLVPDHPGPWDEARLQGEIDGNAVSAEKREFQSIRSFVWQDWGIEPSLSGPYRGSRMEEGGASFYRFDTEFPTQFETGFSLRLLPYSDLSGPRRDEVVSVCYGYAPTGTTFVRGFPAYAERIPRQSLAIWSPGFIDSTALSVVGDSARDRAQVVGSGAFDLPYIGGSAWKFPFDEVGDFTELTYTVQKNGNYLLSALIRRNSRGGRFVAEVDGRTVLADMDTYAPGESLESVTLDEVYLEEGPHRIGFRVSGKAAQSEGYELSLDGIELREQEPEFVRKWLLIGPFVIAAPASGGTLGEGYLKEFPPEEHIDIDAQYQGGAGPVKWDWYAPGPSGYVDLYNGLPISALNGVAYALTHVKSPSDRDAVVYFGSDDGATIWVNGRRVYDKPVTRAFVVDQDEFTVNLRKGWNTVLVKVGNAGGGWGFAMRMPAPKGTYEFQPYPPKE